MSDLTITNRHLGSIFGNNYGSGTPEGYTVPLAIACNALDTVADELEVIRHAVGAEGLDSDQLDLVLFRMAERMRFAAEVAWDKHRAESKPATVISEDEHGGAP